MSLYKPAETAVIRKYVALNHELMLAALAGLGMETVTITELEMTVVIADAIHHHSIRWGSRYRQVEQYQKNGLEREVQSLHAKRSSILYTSLPGWQLNRSERPSFAVRNAIKSAS